MNNTTVGTADYGTKGGHSVDIKNLLGTFGFNSQQGEKGGSYKIYHSNSPVNRQFLPK
jgi:hypothetical protein